jgi:hypothetical protein
MVWFSPLIKAVLASGGVQALNERMARAMVLALKDLKEGRRVSTAIGHTIRGFISGWVEKGLVKL